MADQKTVAEANGETSVIRNLSDFGSDVMTLVELQWRLMLLDAREGSKAIIPAASTVVVGATIALMALPILMVSLAHAIMEFGHLRPSLAFLITGVIGIAVGGIVAAVGWNTLQKGSALFTRSRQEFDANTRWMKNVLQRMGNSPRVGGSR